MFLEESFPGWMSSLRALSWASRRAKTPVRATRRTRTAVSQAAWGWIRGSASGSLKGVAATITELFGNEAIVQVPVPSMGAEDFAFYLKYIPGMLLRIGTASGPDTRHPLHDSRFDIDEDSLVPAAELMACVLISHLKRQAIREATAA